MARSKPANVSFVTVSTKLLERLRRTLSQVPSTPGDVAYLEEQVREALRLVEEMAR